MSTFKEWAHAYLSIGLHPIPCGPRTKVPIVSWKPFQIVPPTSSQVEAWWTREPNANIGLVLGRGMFAVDLDGGAQAEALLAEQGIVLPEGPRSRTASGYHVFLSAPDAVPDRVGLLMTNGGKPQVDIRGVGFVVAPPSIHPTGATYEWEYPLLEGQAPPLAPAALLKLIQRTSEPSPAAAKQADKPTDRTWAATLLKGVNEGGRDAACTRLAGYFLGLGMDTATVEALLLESFARNCSPVFDEKSVHKCVRSIASRESVSGQNLTIIPRHIAQVLEDLSHAVTHGPPAPVTTPFPALNHFLTGGFAPGELVYLGARPGVGKTALGLEIARHAAQRGRPTLVVSREMTNVAIARRIVSQHGRISASSLKRAQLSAVDTHKFTDALDDLRPLPLWLTDDAVSLAQIQAMVATMAAHDGIGLVIVDYLQLVRAPAEIRERRLQVEAVSQGLKTLALAYKLPVLCLSSLSRASPDARDKRPTLSSLRESGELEHDADIILLLHRDYHENTTECIVAKNRDGRLGTAHLMFLPDYVAFHEVTDSREYAAYVGQN